MAGLVSDARSISGLRPAWLPQAAERKSARQVRCTASGDSNEVKQILVCTNKVCRKSGSPEVAEYFRHMAPPGIEVETTGCLGKCGAGPNIVFLPEELFISHCNTPAHVARLLERQCAAQDADTNLKAFQIQSQASAAFAKGQYREAEALFTRGIELKPSGGLHFMYCNRSACRTALGDVEGAFADIEAARDLKPNWTLLLVREAEAFEAKQEPQRAMETYNQAANSDPEFRRSKLFKRKQKELQPVLEMA